MERPMITISGDPSSRLKPMKPPARRTSRALRLRAPFLAGTSSRAAPPAPSHLCTALAHGMTPLPAVALHQQPHQQGAPQPAQGEDGDSQGVEEGQGARGQPVSEPLGPRGIVESLYVLQGRDTHRHQVCWQKGEDKGRQDL